MQRLPQESWTQTILRDKPVTGLADLPPAPSGSPRFGPWRHGDYLLARMVNALERNNYLTALAGGLTPAPQPPEPLPVPGSGRPVRKQSDAQVAYLRSLRAKSA